MASMGYIAGTGLGKHGEGRLEPITATVLPPGKSLGKYSIFNIYHPYLIFYQTITVTGRFPESKTEL